MTEPIEPARCAVSFPGPNAEALHCHLIFRHCGMHVNWDAGATWPNPPVVPAGQAPATDQTTLSDVERQFLTFALDLAFDRMVSDDGFTSEDEAALEKLRRLAAVSAVVVRRATDETRAAGDYARALATPPSAEAAAYIRDRLATTPPATAAQQPKETRP